jgi:prepilin-type N-terminal cleavage/methylation domain-containing protein
MKSARTNAGFTLIELMIVVAILGLLAAIAIPSMVAYVRRAKTVEGYEQVKQIFNHAAVYYLRERADSGLGSSSLIACTVGPADNKLTPSPQKQLGDYSDPAFIALGFASSPTYFRYELENKDGAARCGVSASTELYLIRARGDLDGDGTGSRIELATGSNADNELFHARSYFVENETE